MTATAISSPAACFQSIFACVYGATSAAACACALRMTYGAASAAAPRTAVCFSTRRRPGCAGFVVGSRFIVSSSLSADRRERAAARCVFRAFGLQQQVLRESAGGVVLAEVEQARHHVGMLLRDVRRVRRRPR